MRILGIDFGSSRIGFAIGDSETSLAVPLAVEQIKGADDPVSVVLGRAYLRAVDKLVVGMPLSMSGDVGPQGELVQSFIAALGKRTDLPVVSWDERLTSVQADRLLSEIPSNSRRRTKKKTVINDSVAAMVILQSYLDSELLRLRESGDDRGTQ